MLQKYYKIEIINNLEELWSVWRSLGVYSEGSIFAMAPEEAVIGLSIFGRYDQRLFDEALSFILKHSKFLSKNRLLSLSKKLDDNSKQVFYMILLFLANNSNDTRFQIYSKKIKIISKEYFFINLNNTTGFIGKKEDPFFLKYGFKRNLFTKSNKLRNLEFIAENNQWIKAKLYWGNTVRADTIMELICNNSYSAPGIATNTGYTQKSIWNVLIDFELAGLISGTKSYNRINYSLTNSSKNKLLSFKVKTKKVDVFKWIKTGYYLSSFSKLSKDSSELLIESEKKRISKIFKTLKL